MKCSRCQRGFTSLAAFDKHLAGKPSRRKPCHDPATLGMVQTETGKWATKTLTSMSV